MLYWRDGLDVVKHLFSNPLFAHCIDLAPYQEYEETALEGPPERVYGEFMSADLAWNIQVCGDHPSLACSLICHHFPFRASYPRAIHF
jgi:hypothetical protein